MLINDVKEEINKIIGHEVKNESDVRTKYVRSSGNSASESLIDQFFRSIATSLVPINMSRSSPVRYTEEVDDGEDLDENTNEDTANTDYKVEENNTSVRSRNETEQDLQNISTIEAMGFSYEDSKKAYYSSNRSIENAITKLLEISHHRS